MPVPVTATAYHVLTEEPIDQSFDVAMDQESKTDTDDAKKKVDMKPKRIRKNTWKKPTKSRPAPPLPEDVAEYEQQMKAAGRVKVNTGGLKPTTYMRADGTIPCTWCHGTFTREKLRVRRVCGAKEAVQLNFYTTACITTARSDVLLDSHHVRSPTSGTCARLC